MATATWHGTVIATSDDVVDLDGYTYFPLDAVVPGVISETRTTSVSTFKGRASYFTLEIGGWSNEDAGWSYRDPHRAPASIRGRIAFWKGVDIAA